jgi:hypothetical protein
MALCPAKPKEGGTMTRRIKFPFLLLAALAVWAGLAACSKKSQPPASDATAPLTPAVAPASVSPPAEPAKPAAGVKADMRNVLFHLTPRASARLIILSGELWPTGKNPVVVFDDKTSFEVRVTNGTVSISPAALAEIMNSYVFARSDAPVKDLTVAIDQEKNQLVIKGKLHSKGDISFATAGYLSVTSDGRIRVHTDKITAMKVPVKGMMGLFGIELAKVVNTSKIPGMDTDKNDLLMDLGTLLPPPHIRGKLSSVRLERDAIVTTFGDGGKSAGPPKEKGSYMALTDSSVRFGAMLMDPADLTVLDMDEAATLEWNQDHYKEQLVAGYSKITPTFGLRAYVKDYSKLGKPTQ